MLMPRRPKAFSWLRCVRHFVVGAATRQPFGVQAAAGLRRRDWLFQDACRVMYAVGRWTLRVQQCIRFCVVVHGMSGGWVAGVQWPASLYKWGVGCDQGSGAGARVCIKGEILVCTTSSSVV